MMYVKSSMSDKRSKSKSKDHLHSMGVPMQYASQMNSNPETRTVNHASRKRGKSTKSSKSSLSSSKIIFISLIIGAVGLLYLNHIYAVQQDYKEVLQLQRDLEKARRLYSDRKFTYDRMIGPAEVYDRAKVLGLQDGGPADGIIYLEK